MKKETRNGTNIKNYIVIFLENLIKLRKVVKFFLTVTNFNQIDQTGVRYKLALERPDGFF